MYAIAKILCLFLYFAAALSLLIVMPSGIALTLQYTTLLFVVVHVLEIIFFRKYVRLYPGPVAVSIVFTLLFGFAHWKPLLDAGRQTIDSSTL